MSMLHAGHTDHYSLAMGVVYCAQTRTVFVSPHRLRGPKNLRTGEICSDRTIMIAIMNAIQDAWPMNDVRAVVALLPGESMYGLDNDAQNIDKAPFAKRWEGKE